jgi:hypothetical protein
MPLAFSVRYVTVVFADVASATLRLAGLLLRCVGSAHENHNEAGQTRQTIRALRLLAKI